MKRALALILTLLLIAAPMALAEGSYSPDGKVCLENSEGEIREIQIAEIQQDDAGVTVYINGNADFNVYIATIDFMTGGMKRIVNVAAWMEDADGNRIEPAETHGYIGGADSGNSLSFTFENAADAPTLALCLTSNKDAVVKIPVAELQISEDLKMSDKIVTLN